MKVEFTSPLSESGQVMWHALANGTLANKANKDLKGICLFWLGSSTLQFLKSLSLLPLEHSRALCFFSKWSVQGNLAFIMITEIHSLFTKLRILNRYHTSSYMSWEHFISRYQNLYVIYTHLAMNLKTWELKKLHRILNWTCLNWVLCFMVSSNSGISVGPGPEALLERIHVVMDRTVLWGLLDWGLSLTGSCLEGSLSSFPREPFQHGSCSIKVFKHRKNRVNYQQHVKKQRHYFANKGPSGQGYGFSSGHVWMWDLDCEESWAPKNWCFELWCWWRLLRVPWTARRSN